MTNYTTAIDIWAVGCILAELYLLRPLFKGRTEGDQIFAAFKLLGSFTPEERAEYNRKVPFDCGMLNDIMQYKRINLKEYFSMVTDITNFEDLLLKMLQYIPERRITAREAMNHPFFDDVRSKFKGY